MTEYILLEANRLRSNEQQNNPDGTDTFNNIWTNNVSTTGIEVKAGDIISVEGAAINAIGNEIESTMEFIGPVNQERILDNKVGVNFNYYVNHNGRYTIPLPFKDCAPYMRGGAGGANPDWTDLETLRCRQVGNILIGAAAALNPIDGLTYQTTLHPVISQPVLKDIGGGTPAQNEGGYIVEPDHRVLNGAGTDTGIRIDILEVEAIGNTDGYITKYSVSEIPVNAFTTTGIEQTYFIERKNANPNQETTIVLTAGDNTTLCGRIDMNPNGLRYYKVAPDYINMCVVNFDGMNNGVNDLQNGPNPLGSVPTTGSPYVLASTDINLEIPLGFSTPQDVAKTLTDELNKPTLVNKDNNQTPFMDIASFSSDISQPYQTFYDNGLILETSTYKPMESRLGSFENSNPPRLSPGGELVSVGGIAESNSGFISSFYKSVYYEDPKRMEGLQVFRQMVVKENYIDDKNELWTGLNQAASQGDYGNQNIGQYGNIPRLFTKFLTHPTKFFDNTQEVIFSNNQRFYPLLTNMFWREETLEKLAAGFRKAEEYRGRGQALRPTGPITDTTINPDHFSVALDVGVYADGLSQAGTLKDISPTNFGNPVGSSKFTILPGAKPYQRNKYLNQSSDTATGTAFRTTTTSIDGVPSLNANGVSFNKDGTFGDGQVLPTLWVASRWNDKYRADNYPAVSSALEDFMNENNFQVPFETNAFDGYNGPNFSGTFKKTYTDKDGITRNYEDYISWAKKYNIAAIPVFPFDGDPSMTPGEGNQYKEPYIAFICFDYLDEAVTNNFEFPWQADADLCKPGEYIGLDTSFTRNKAVYTTNLQPSNLMYIGANNPQVQFNEQVSRFQIGGLTTSLYEGNPFLSQYPQEFPDPTDTPNNEIFTNGKLGSIARCEQKQNPRGASAPITALTIGSRSNYNTRQENSSIIDANSGISVGSISLFNADGSVLKEITDYSLSDETLFTNTLLSKMGFTLSQIIPEYGNIQARFVNAFLNDPREDTLNIQFNDVVKPLTTNSFVSSEQTQAIALNSSNLPIYGMGVPINTRFASADVSTDFLTAKNLPSKLDYPYMMIYTNLGIEMKYYGGIDSHSKLPCLAFISRNYSAGDFFYNVGDNYNVIVSRDFVLTDITTDIRLPDGSRPRLSPHSCVMYKITSPATTIPPVLTPKEQEGNKLSSSKK